MTAPAANLFPVIGTAECRRYLAQARATPNAIREKIRAVIHIRAAGKK